MFNKDSIYLDGGAAGGVGQASLLKVLQLADSLIPTVVGGVAIAG